MNEGNHTISSGSTLGSSALHLQYNPERLYAFLHSFVKIGIIFNSYCNKILSFLDNAEKNERSEIHSSLDLSE